MSLRISTRTRIGAAAAVLLAAGVTTTFAAFTDSGEVGTTLASGSLDLKFDGDHDGNPDAYTISFGPDAENLKPGDVVSQDLEVSNSGSVPATVALASTSVVSSAVAPDVALEDTILLTITAGGDTLYDGTLADAAFAGLHVGAGSASGVPLRLVATLPQGATTGIADQELDVTLSFTAEQA